MAREEEKNSEWKLEKYEMKWNIVKKSMSARNVEMFYVGVKIISITKRKSKCTASGIRHAAAAWLAGSADRL